MDFPDLGLLAPKRGFSVSALQSLTMFNNEFVLHGSDWLTGRVEREQAGVTAQVDRAVELAWPGGSQGDLANLGDVLATIVSQAYGKFLLGVTGFGLMCYRVHSCFNGYFRRFSVNT